MVSKTACTGEKMNLPVIIHSREAAQDTLTIMKEAHEMHIPGVIHCFSYSSQIAELYVQMGYYIGVGGVITFKNAKKLKGSSRKNTIRIFIIGNGLSLYGARAISRKKKQFFISSLYSEKIAEIKGVTEQQVIDVTEQNAYRLYQLHQRLEVILSY